MVKFGTQEPACASLVINSRRYGGFALEMDTCMYVSADGGGMLCCWTQRAAIGMRRDRYRYRKILPTRI